MPRGATTFLYHQLSTHPGVFLPFRKEVNYFNVHYGRGSDWYQSLYAERAPNQITGDISPPCFLDPTAIEKIKSHATGTKIILIVRDPAEWAVSLYHQFNSFDRELSSLQTFMEQGHRYKIGEHALEVSFERAWIAQRVRAYQAAFGDNLLLYRFSSFKQDPLRMLNLIEDFLSLPRYFVAENFTNRRINESHRKNFKLLSWVLSRERVIDFVGKTVPRAATMAIRKTLDQASVRTTGERCRDSAHSDDELALAARYLEGEQHEIDKIFGSRSTLRPTTTAACRQRLG